MRDMKFPGFGHRLIERFGLSRDARLRHELSLRLKIIENTSLSDAVRQREARDLFDKLVDGTFGSWRFPAVHKSLGFLETAVPRELFVLGPTVTMGVIGIVRGMAHEVDPKIVLRFFEIYSRSYVLRVADTASAALEAGFQLMELQVPMAGKEDLARYGVALAGHVRSIRFKDPVEGFEKDYEGASGVEIADTYKQLQKRSPAIAQAYVAQMAGLVSQNRFSADDMARACDGLGRVFAQFPELRTPMRIVSLSAHRVVQAGTVARAGAPRV